MPHARILTPQPLTRADRNFVLQQGLPDPAPGTCRPLMAALTFQPRVVALMFLAAILTQRPVGFLALAGLLWWGAVLPARNAFDALYRLVTRGNPSAVLLPLAPPPRRFAQALAGTFAAVIGLALSQGWRGLAYGVEGAFLLAIGALAFARLCFGSFLYYLLRGQFRFALRTLPWGDGV
jgi:Domain of unknown function (DUF4395)